MTLPPLDEKILVIGKKRGYPTYKVGPKCSNPTCHKGAEHAHHMFRRSDLGDSPWVWIDGWTVGNLTGLCFDCHLDVTGDLGGHKAAIRIDLDTKTFLWCLTSTDQHMVVSYHPVGPIEPQPPTPESLAERASGQDELGSDLCPTCGHIKRVRRPLSGGEGRQRATWTVKVPDDEREHGAEILDQLVEALAPLVPSGDSSTTGRYYVLVPALAYALMDVNEFIQNMQGVGG